ncbi:hypothetical protein Cgig2_008755 [Carnegiea gigantea]|uniref:Uncharacterized protein n=1 Tax=Carnegiea gigantea TaxID=171969 RepID=A0A9Q1JM77_9CARY|nr:hypothetical protein Cgig2_008755 [Carnegiea gigantea]
MALVMSVSGEVKPRRSSFRGERGLWMLKDCLRDDMSSCSSNGFRTFPRRQCCAASERFVGASMSFNGSRQRRETSSVQISGGERRRREADSAEKLLEEDIKEKLLDDEEIFIRREIGGVGAEKYQPSDLSNNTTVTNSSTTTTTTTTNSNSNSNSDDKSDSWSDITFTSNYYLTCWSENDAVDRREKTPAKDDEELEEEEVSRSVGVTAAKSGWHNNEAVKKEQLSPISILDFPESDERSLSPFTLRITRLKGTQERLMKKLGRFESLAALGLEPLNLGNLASCTQVKDRSPKISIQSCSTPSYVVSGESEEEEEHCQENEAMKKARQLLNVMKAKMPIKATYTFDPNHTLLDFFQENPFYKEDDVLLKEAKDWLHGHYDKTKRETYIQDMDGQGRRPRDAKPRKEEVGVELADEVLAYLIEELLQECCP